MVVTTRVLEKARDLTNRRNGRRSISEEQIHFKEHIPLALKNFVRGGGLKSSNTACAKDLMAVVNCLSKFDMNQSVCSQEIARFNACNESHALNALAEKEARSSTKIPVGEHVKLTGNQMNAYFKKFPLNSQKR